MGLTLSEQKTRITKLTDGYRFLGCRVRHKWDNRLGLWCRFVLPPAMVKRSIYSLLAKPPCGEPDVLMPHIRLCCGEGTGSVPSWPATMPNQLSWVGARCVPAPDRGSQLTEQQ